MMNTKNETDRKNGIASELQEALGLFGKTLNIALIYGVDHPSVHSPLVETHTALSTALENSPKITIGLLHGTLTVNNKIITEYTVHLRALERRLVSLKIPHLVIRPGFSADEFRHLVNALCTANAKEGQTVEEKLSEAGLDNIKTEEISYVAQHEGEHLVGNGEPYDIGGEDGENSGGDSSKENPEASVHVEQIVAFLKGESASSGVPSGDLEKMLAEPEKLGRLIMESVSIRQSAQSLEEGESLADIVIGCLRRTYDDLNKQKSFKSSRKKASLNKAMLLLEKTVVDKIRNSMGENQAELDDQILAALHDMEEQRQVEIIATRYAEQHKKISQAERELIQYARKYGEDKARQALAEANVPEQELHHLMAQSRQSGSGEERGDGSGEGFDMGSLAIVLDKLEHIMQFDETPPALMKAIVDETRTEIKTVDDHLAYQVDRIEEQVERHAAGDTNTDRADILLQISQLSLKLAQPLTVIIASVESAIKQTSHPDLQNDLLELADESGQIMKGLLKRLTELVGYPSMQDADVRLPDQ